MSRVLDARPGAAALSPPDNDLIGTDVRDRKVVISGRVLKKKLEDL